MKVEYKEIDDFLNNVLPNINDDECIVNPATISIMHVYTKNPFDCINEKFFKSDDILKEFDPKVITKQLKKNKNNCEYSFFRIIKGMNRIYDQPYDIQTMQAHPENIESFYDEKIFGVYYDGLIKVGSTIQNPQLTKVKDERIVPYFIYNKKDIMNILEEASSMDYNKDLREELIKLVYGNT